MQKKKKTLGKMKVFEKMKIAVELCSWNRILLTNEKWKWQKNNSINPSFPQKPLPPSSHGPWLGLLMTLWGSGSHPASPCLTLKCALDVTRTALSSWVPETRICQVTCHFLSCVACELLPSKGHGEQSSLPQPSRGRGVCLSVLT